MNQLVTHDSIGKSHFTGNKNDTNSKKKKCKADCLKRKRNDVHSHIATRVPSPDTCQILQSQNMRLHLISLTPTKFQCCYAKQITQNTDKKGTTTDTLYSQGAMDHQFLLSSAFGL